MHINTWEAVVVVSASLLNLVQNVGFLTWILPPDKINMHQYRSSKSFNVEDGLPPYIAHHKNETDYWLFEFECQKYSSFWNA